MSLLWLHFRSLKERDIRSSQEKQFKTCIVSQRLQTKFIYNLQNVSKLDYFLLKIACMHYTSDEATRCKKFIVQIYDGFANRGKLPYDYV